MDGEFLEHDPEAFEDMYDMLLELVDEGRLPVVCFLRPGLVYYRSFSVEDWSPVLTAHPQEREHMIVQVVRFSFREGQRDGPDS